MNRKKAREWMTKVYYQLDMNKVTESGNEGHYLNKKELGDQQGYAETLFNLYFTHGELVDEAIDHYSIGWKVSRMAKTDVAILRVAAMEVLFLDDVPEAVAINEAVNLAKTYGTEESPRFINAILAKIAKNSAEIREKEQVE